MPASQAMTLHPLEATPCDKFFAGLKGLALFSLTGHFRGPLLTVVVFPWPALFYAEDSCQSCTCDRKQGESSLVQVVSAVVPEWFLGCH